MVRKRRNKRSGVNWGFTFGIIVVFILVILLVLSVLGYPPQSLVSLLIKEQDISFNEDTTVLIPKEVNLVLTSLYKSTSNEWVFCVYGKQINPKEILLDNVRETNILHSTPESVTYETCKKNSMYLGTIHNHPPPDKIGYRASCKFSMMDVYSFASQKEILSGVICGVKTNGEGKYGWYNQYSLEESYAYKILE